MFAKAPKGLKVAVSERAVVARINRKLKKSGEQLKRCRGFYDRSSDSWYPNRDLGWYYVVNDRNHLVGVDIDLDAYGHELGVLGPWEKLADE